MSKKSSQSSRPVILYIITRGILGGAQKHILQLSQQLKSDFDICVIIGEMGPLLSSLRDEGIQVYHFPSLGNTISPFKDLYSFFKILSLIRQVRPSLVSTHSSKAGILGRLASKLCGVPVIFTAHGWAFTDGVPEFKRKIYIRIEKLAARWADKIICVSENDRQLALNYGVASHPKLLTIHNGMSLQDKHSRSVRGTGDLVRIIMVARITEQKDHKLLLKAISTLHTKTPYILTLVGDGELTSVVQKYSAELGVEDKVEFLGARKDVAKLLDESDIFVLTSKWEGFPRSILEAMRAGLPVVASDVGGCKEAVIEGETGYLVPRGDEEALKQRLKGLIDDPFLRNKMGQAGIQRFLDHFTFDIMFKKTFEVYQQVMGKTQSQDKG